MVAFVGSGLSSHVYDSWDRLILNLCQKCDVRQPPRAKRTDPTSLMKCADKCRVKGGKEYRAYLKDQFTPQPVYRRRAYECLAKIPFRAYVTTNFDPMLEDELKGCKPQLQISVYQDLNIQHLSNREVRALYYLHGKIIPEQLDSVDHLVLGLNEFETAYASRDIVGPVNGFLQQLFTHERVVFFGCGLTEPLMQKVIRKCAGIRANIGKEGRHFAFLPHVWLEKPYANREIDSASEENEDLEMRKCGIDVLRYDKKDRFHSTIEEMLQDLSILPKGGRSNATSAMLPGDDL